MQYKAQKTIIESSADVLIKTKGARGIANNVVHKFCV
jgi:hypothetical protein